MQNNKSKIITVLIIIIVVLVAVFFFLAGDKRTVISPINSISQNVSSIPSADDINSLNIPAGDSRILGNREDLIASSVWPDAELHGLVSFNGSVKGGYFFEGNILINVLDANKKVLKLGHATAKTDWMTSGPVNFEGNIDLTGLPKGGAFLEIKQDDPSGGESGKMIKQILIPIFIK